MSELNKLYELQDKIINKINNKRNEIELFEEDWTEDLDYELDLLEQERDRISEMINASLEKEFNVEANASDLLQELRKVTIELNAHIDTYDYKNIDTYRDTIKLAIRLRKRASSDKKYNTYITALNKTLSKLIGMNKVNGNF